MKIRSLSALAMTLFLFLGGCGGDDESSEGDDGGGGDERRSGGEPPAFLLQGWIVPTSDFTAATYDFTQIEAAGQRTVEIRTWQRIGSLGWQSMQAFTALFTVNNQQITLSSPTGFQDVWQIIAVGQTSMTVQSQRDGTTFELFNCFAPVWPPLILASTRGCQR
ncbi:hypothetical protein [Hyalangium rubrum]|uniref:Lipoprotein n=1 Tax=Hyalangium rubrum TaxID=3103134 RepID=A0ABU5GW04_9BACT|nr:hypothetical protein [Hyalangium sp. s54d21]MDY7225024.1 hypothetical protein [Hyalangium sp. s54d21]